MDANKQTTTRKRMFPLSELKSNLTCSICHGYLIDATTITECMHTFCKSCLLQRVESGRSSCPRCGALVQRSRLAEQLRLDHAVQALVYAAVPGLWQEEQRRRKHFVDHHPLSSTVAPKLQQPTCFSPTDPISLSLDFVPHSKDDDMNLSGPNSPQAIGRRYFRCPAAVAVHHFQKLLSLKFELPSHFVVEIYCSSEKLDPSYRLMDVAYKTSWTQEEPLRLEYKITRSQASKTSASSTVSATVNGTTTTAAAAAPAAPNGSAANAAAWRSKTAPTTPTSASEPSGNVAPGVKRSSGPLPPPPPSPPTPAPSKPSKRSRPAAGGLCDDDNNVSTKKKQQQTPPPLSESVVIAEPAAELPVKRRGRKKKRKRRKSQDLVPVMEPNQPLKVKIVERAKTTDPNWSSNARPSGVELLVQAAEFTSRQHQEPVAAATAAEQQPAQVPQQAKDASASSTPKRASSPPGLIPINPSAVATNTTDALNNNKNKAETPTPQHESVMKDAKEDADKSTVTVTATTTLADEEDDGHLMIADEVNSNENSRQSTGRDSGMANDDDDVDGEDSSGALDLSSKSTRATPPIVGADVTTTTTTATTAPSKKPPTPLPEQRKSSSSPQLVQQRSSTLHSITDSLAQRQQQMLMQQRPSPSKPIAIAPPVPNNSRSANQQQQQQQQQQTDALRNLMSLSSHHHHHHHMNVAAAAAAAASVPNPAVTQRFFVAMHQFAAAAAAAAAASPNQHRATPKPSQQSNKSRPFGFIRRPF